MLDAAELPTFLHHSLHSDTTAKIKSSWGRMGLFTKDSPSESFRRFSLRRRATAEFSPAFQGREEITRFPAVALATIEFYFSRR